MNKEQSNQMFGVDSISDWFDDISCSHTFTRDGKTAMAISLLSDVQEMAANGMVTASREEINRIKYLLDISSNEELTRRIVGKLMRYLESNNFEIVAVLDEEGRYDTSDLAAAMGHIFAVGKASLRVRSHIAPPGTEHGILLIPNNGKDIISNWDYSVDDADGFNAVMEAFTNPGS